MLAQHRTDTPISNKLVLWTSVIVSPRLDLLELVSMRFPALLLDKVRKEAEQNHMALAHEMRGALETQYLVGLPPPMVELLEEDRRKLRLSRQAYFHSLLDARYRKLLTKEPASPTRSRRK